MTTTLVANLGLGHIRLKAMPSPDTLNVGAEYGEPAGSPLLREAVASWEGVQTAEVAITTGASLALVATLAAFEGPCSILCPRPYYPAYPKLAAMLGLELLYYDLHPETAWNPCIESMANLVRPDTQALLLNVPSNPTGSLPNEASLSGMRELARRSNLQVITDEVYADFIYTGSRLPDLREVFGRDSVVRLRSFSKLFGMPGERLGYVIAAPVVLRDIVRAHWTLAMSPPATAQAIALSLLRSEPERRLCALRGALEENRERAISILGNCARIKLVAPRGGTFCWFEIVDAPCDSRTLANACASRAGVVVMPGSVFGADHPIYLRVSFAVPQDELTRGLAALVDFLDNV